MNKKGFTLTELLVVIAILGVIAVITVPTIGNVIQKSREDAYNEQERSIINAARAYMANHSKELPAQTVGSSICKSVEVLRNDGLLANSKKEGATGIINPMYNRTPVDIEVKEKSEYFNGGVKVTWNGSKYTYEYFGNSNCTEES